MGKAKKARTFSPEEVDKYEIKPKASGRTFSPKQVDLLAVPEEEYGGTQDEDLNTVQELGQIADRFGARQLRTFVHEAPEGVGKALGEAAFSTFAPSSETITGSDIMDKYGVKDIPIPTAALTEGANPQEIMMRQEELESTEQMNLPLKAIGGVATDIIMDPYILAKGGMKGIQKTAEMFPKVSQAIKSIGGKATATRLSRMVPSGKMAKLMDRTTPEVAGATILELGLEKDLGNPTLFLEKIRGKVSTTHTRIGSKGFGGKPYSEFAESGGREGGYLQELSEQTNDIVKQVEELPNTKKIDVNLIRDRASTKGGTSAKDLATGRAKYDPKARKVREDIIRQWLPLDKKLSLSELQARKQYLGSLVKTDKYFSPASDAVAQEAEILMDIVSALKGTIEEATKGVMIRSGSGLVDAGQLISRNNNYSHNLLNIVATMDRLPAKELAKASSFEGFIDLLSALGLGGAGAGAMGAIGGSPTMGFLAGVGGYRTMKPKSFENIGGLIPSVKSRAAGKMLRGEVFSGPIKRGAAMGATGVRMGTSIERSIEPVNNSRSPDSIPEALLDIELPRNTEQVMAKPHLLLAKLAQQTDNIDLVVQVKEAMKNPEKMKKFMPILARQYPNLFEYDEYGAWDSKLIDPADRQLYSRDINRREDLNIYQKTEIIDHLNRTNEMLI